MEIKPCLFCNGEPCIQKHVFHGYRIVCLDCRCGTRQFYDTEEEAIEAWNRRASDDQNKRH